jgi:hypothetical protein
MTKIYAIVKPSSYANGSVGDLAAFVTGPYHLYQYERLAGYSLGHEVSFFSDLQSAKDFIQPEVKSRNNYNLRTQCAIVEMELSFGKIHCINNIITFNGFEKRYKKESEEHDYSKKFYSPKWKTRSFQQDYMTSDGALNELRRKLAACKDEKIKKHLSDDVNRSNKEAEVTQNFDKFSTEQLFFLTSLYTDLSEAERNQKLGDLYEAIFNPSEPNRPNRPNILTILDRVPPAKHKEFLDIFSQLITDGTALSLSVMQLQSVQDKVDLAVKYWDRAQTQMDKMQLQNKFKTEDWRRVLDRINKRTALTSTSGTFARREDTTANDNNHEPLRMSAGNN